MTTPPKGGLILVTGVTALKLLEQGYKVRGTARTLSKAEFLKDGPFSKYASNFEIVEVADLEDNGAFNEAVKGVDGIAHIASPFHYRVTDPYVDLINPAVNGTYAGPQLKRVVITSSFAAIVEPHKPGHAFDEAQWNQHSINLAESFKADPTNPSKQVPPNEAYRASKALAERALWDFVKTEKPSFEVAAINPVFVFGPVIHSVKDAESINTSVFLLYKFIAGLNAKVEEGVAPKAFVDVRDVADAHIKALQVEEAKGQRFFNVAGAFTWAEVVEILRKHNKLTKNDYPPTGEKVDSYFFNNTKSKDVLGLNYISLEDSVLATAESVERFL
ncbi:methylglyoxal reductase (NADPH-dependent) gre2 [Orbilia oligospora]|uniref:Methylglyoxal reductase (NADPH-dependent) gre2 n=1 Tax=Orbilia oligospora TaxID=2813651 RepID=A0A7C8JRT9_ORBOL|nr:methylglyoxal reductase (NADPH-dependent) gre2 [Orbilia oligospora]